MDSRVLQGILDAGDPDQDDSKKEVIALIKLEQDWPWIWELIVVTGIVVMGAVMVLLPDFLEFMGEETYDAIVGSGTFANLSADERQHHDWLLGVLGSTMVGWGIMGAFLIWFGLRSWIRNGFPQDQQWSWQALLSGFSLWFVFDTGISAWNEVWFNVIFNTLLYVMLVIPLLALIPKYLENRKESSI